MSPSASSAPRMSVRVTYFPSSAIMPIAIPATGALSGTPASIIDRVDAADARHRRRAVGAHDVGHQTQGVGELVLVRHHRQQGALGERTVADLASPRRAHTTGLTGAVGREVVVVHVALRVLGIERVDHLGHAQHAQRGHVQHLRVAPAEQCRPVCPWQDADLGRQGPDLGGATAVEPHALLDHASTHDLLLQGLPCGTELGRAFGERILTHRRRQVGLGLFLDRAERLVARGTVGHDRGLELAREVRVQLVPQVVAVLRRGRPLHLADAVLRR